MLLGPFTIQEAAHAGISVDQLRGKQWRATVRGIYEARDAPNDLVARCRALAKALPADACFSGITAARLHNWWLPRNAEQLPLHVTVPPNRGVARTGIRATRSKLSASDVVLINGLYVTNGLRTLSDLAADWSLLDLTIMTDAALRRGDCTPEELNNATSLLGRRGYRTLRRTAAFADARSDSPMETLLRLMFVVPGLPPPQPQAVLRDELGGWLAQVDLLGADGTSVFEYDGAAHDSPARHAADVTRWRLLRSYGFEVYPYTARDIFLRPAQILADYQRALGLAEDPRAVQAWLDEWRRSSFGAPRPGYAR